MTPPEAPDNTPGKTPPAVSSCLETLRKRAGFLAAARGRRAVTPGFVLQGRARRPGEADADCIRVGFTASKKVGNAVARNRAKRRLRALAREVLAEHGRPGWDYVLVARREHTATRPFDRMREDLRTALVRLHGGQG